MIFSPPVSARLPSIRLSHRIFLYLVMLTSFHLQNFKAWQDTGRINLAPLTVIFGANSAGKSSLGHWLLALKQTTHRPTAAAPGT